MILLIILLDRIIKVRVDRVLKILRLNQGADLEIKVSAVF